MTNLNIVICSLIQQICIVLYVSCMSRHSISLMGASYVYCKLRFSIKLAFGCMSIDQFPGLNFIF